MGRALASGGSRAAAIRPIPSVALIPLAVLVYGLMGSGRGLTGVAMNTGIMEQVPKHLMGRVQNTFNFAGIVLQVVLALLVGAVAQAVGGKGGGRPDMAEAGGKDPSALAGALAGVYSSVEEML